MSQDDTYPASFAPSLPRTTARTGPPRVHILSVAGREEKPVRAEDAKPQRTVTAPSEALPTSAAYLASTPVRSAFAGAS